VFAELVERAANFDAAVQDRTEDFALVAVQGPRAEQITADLVDAELRELRYYRVAEVEIGGETCYAARTGYTGEDGFELFVPAALATGLWSDLLKAGAADGMVPVGLAARDTLRLEAGMPLYGNELTIETTPFDVGSGRLVKFTETGFVGSDALAVAADEPHQFLVGLHVEGRRPARTGYEVHVGGTPIGVITSGALSPTLGVPIAIARLNRTPAIGDSVEIDVRGSMTSATVVELPFYTRAK